MTAEEIEEMTNGFYIMDGRAIYNIDDATILECCETLNEAKNSIHDFGGDSCIVDAATMCVIDSLLWRRYGKTKE